MTIEVDLGTLITIISIIIGGGGIGGLLKVRYDRRSGKEEKRVAEVERINALYENERLRADTAERWARTLEVHNADLRVFAIRRFNISSEELPPIPQRMV